MRLKKKPQHQAAPIWLELTKTQGILGKKKKKKRRGTVSETREVPAWLDLGLRCYLCPSFPLWLPGCLLTQFRTSLPGVPSKAPGQGLIWPA